MSQQDSNPIKPDNLPSKSNTDDGVQTLDSRPLTFMMKLKARIADNKPTRWIRFGLVALIYILWVIWMGNAWLLLGLPLLFDIYITGYIPFTWWKKSENKMVRTVMSWVDAIVYALVLAYFVFAFVGQNYQIPSSSLEKTLLTGDYLFVNKAVYGPRVPMTPVHFPLVHNTLFGYKSYLDHPSVEYHRLKGLRSVERGDIVVFNFPAGDTIMERVQNPDYYTLVKMFGRDALLSDPAQFGKRMYRPVDRRENYVKRCVGLPGDRIKIKEGVIYINDQAVEQPKDVQFNYLFQTRSGYLTDAQWEELGVSTDDRHTIVPQKGEDGFFQYYDFKAMPDGRWYPISEAPLTAEMVEKLKNNPDVIHLMQEPAPQEGLLFPDKLSAQWTRADYGGNQGIWIPKKGSVLKLDANSWPIYERAVRVYENNPTAELREDGKVYIDGKPCEYYRFKMDYYFMMGDNRDNSLDSRYWGFVPEDHVVGTPWRVLISFDKDKGLLNGGIRWNRIFKDANPDKK